VALFKNFADVYLMLIAHILCIILVAINNFAEKFKCCKLTALYVGYPLKVFSNFTYMMGLVSIVFFWVTFTLKRPTKTEKNMGKSMSKCMNNTAYDEGNSRILL
jgi:hypothetical protein